MPTWEIEDKARQAGHHWICGCDEAGAGPLAGPVYAAAVVLPRMRRSPAWTTPRSSPPSGGRLCTTRSLRKPWPGAVAAVGPEEIDEIDILNARMLAMERAIGQLDPAADYALVDGNRDHGSRVAITIPHETVVKGDSRSVSVAAASVLAKVSRDRTWRRWRRSTPSTALRSTRATAPSSTTDAGYIRPPAHPPPQLPGQVGGKAPWMSGRSGATGGRPPWRTGSRPVGAVCWSGSSAAGTEEIDLIARDREGTVCFIEVKTRSSSRFAQAREFVTEAKRRRLRAAASAYLAREGLGEAACRFDVAEVYPGGGWDRPGSITSSAPFDGVLEVTDMDYLSTRDKTLALSAAEAIKMGLSRDGGLFTPARFPSISPLELEVMCEMSYQQRCAYVMGLFLDDFTPEEVSDFALRAYGPEKFDDPAVAPLRRVGGKTWCLELWHGPTSAFKDMALQMLPSSSPPA